MENHWTPLVKPHSFSVLRCSNRHDVDMYQNLITDFITPRDTHPCLSRVQVVAFQNDIIYVSSDSTVTVLHSVLSDDSKNKCQSELAQQITLVSHASDIQVFETKLSVMDMAPADNYVLLHTMYQVIKLTKYDYKYTMETVSTSEEHILGLTIGGNGAIYTLSSSRLSSVSPDKPLVDITDLWRSNILEQASVLLYQDYFAIMEPTAFHFVNQADYKMIMTIPNEELDFKEKLLNFSIIEDKLLLVTSSFLLIYLIDSTLELTVLSKLSHHVQDANHAQFFSCGDFKFDSKDTMLVNFKVSIFSDLKCCFFDSSALSRSSITNFIMPYSSFKVQDIQAEVLVRQEYLSLTVDKRNTVTSRLATGISGALVHKTGHFVLSKQHDLFGTISESSSPWDLWLSRFSGENEQDTMETYSVGNMYMLLIKDGFKTRRSRTEHPPEPEFPDLALLDDKYSTMLTTLWDWDL